MKWVLILMLGLVVKIIIFDIQIGLLKNEIKESRHREELLYQECKNLDYLVDVLTQKDVK